MTDETKKRFSDVLRVVISIMGGAILTLLFQTANKTDSNTERIAKLEAIIEPMKTVSSDVAWLKATADRNVSTLDRIEKKIDEHINKGK